MARHSAIQRRTETVKPDLSSKQSLVKTQHHQSLPFISVAIITLLALYIIFIGLLFMIFIAITSVIEASSTHLCDFNL